MSTGQPGEGLDHQKEVIEAEQREQGNGDSHTPGLGKCVEERIEWIHAHQSSERIHWLHGSLLVGMSEATLVEAEATEEKQQSTGRAS